MLFGVGYLKLNLKLVQGPIHSLEKAKSKIPVNQNIGGIAAGTAFAASAAFSVTVSNDGTQQMLSSMRRDPKGTLANSLNSSKRAVLNIKKGQMDEEVKDNYFNAGINAFAGIQANITPFGGLQWLDPEHPKDFSDLAKISPTLGLSAGAGGSANFQLYFAKGAFRFRASIAACYGVGGKGALEFMVDFSEIDQLIKFIAYQLLYISFKKLVYMTEGTFMLLHKVSMMLPFEKDSSFIQSVALINLHFADFKSRMQIAEKRLEMCRKINAKEQWLKYLSPESRGCFLYHITRHGLVSGVLNPSQRDGTWVLNNVKEYDLTAHKEAVLNLFRSVTVVSHWTNTLQHMSTDGDTSVKTIAQNESELLDFLNLGRSHGFLPLADLAEVKRRINQDHNFPKDYRSGNRYLDEYLKMRGERILAYPKDYKIADFGSSEFMQAKIAQDIEKPELFLAQAPQPIDELGLDQYGQENNALQTWQV